jgi:hypothetical protein
MFFITTWLAAIVAVVIVIAGIVLKKFLPQWKKISPWYPWIAWAFSFIVFLAAVFLAKGVGAPSFIIFTTTASKEIGAQIFMTALVHSIYSTILAVFFYDLAKPLFELLTKGLGPGEK